MDRETQFSARPQENIWNSHNAGVQITSEHQTRKPTTIPGLTWSSCSWQSTTEGETSVCLDTNRQTLPRAVWIPPLCQQRPHFNTPDTLRKSGQEGAGKTSSVWEQSILPSSKPRYNCSMIFNVPVCTWTWKSNKCFEIPNRFNQLRAPESNRPLN